ncbi:EthD domain-containing protein [Rhexocercosporidium sp. MPI-PUGE-AT-0058]|nr:EthD domain-containing protein [Rhexocercosporidium sp. MPI-PUGE-AT-0058]
MASKERFLKLTIMQRRNPAVAEENFHAHWTRKHAPLASAWLQRNGIIGYTQYHTPKSTRDLAAGVAKEFGWTVSDYDGNVEFLVRSVEDLKKAVEDPEYPEKVLPDEQRFMDQSNSVVTVGWEEVYVKDGKVVNIDQSGGSVYG